MTGWPQDLSIGLPRGNRRNVQILHAACAYRYNVRTIMYEQIYYSMPRVQKSAGFDCDSLTDFDENVKNSSEIEEI